MRAVVCGILLVFGGVGLDFLRCVPACDFAARRIELHYQFHAGLLEVGRFVERYVVRIHAVVKQADNDSASEVAFGKRAYGCIFRCDVALYFRCEGADARMHHCGCGFFWEFYGADAFQSGKSLESAYRHSGEYDIANAVGYFQTFDTVKCGDIAARNETDRYRNCHGAHSLSFCRHRSGCMYGIYSFECTEIKFALCRCGEAADKKHSSKSEIKFFHVLLFFKDITFLRV